MAVGVQLGRGELLDGGQELDCLVGVVCLLGQIVELEGEVRCQQDYVVVDDVEVDDLDSGFEEEFYLYALQLVVVEEH